MFQYIYHGEDIELKLICNVLETHENKVSLSYDDRHTKEEKLS